MTAKGFRLDPSEMKKSCAFTLFLLKKEQCKRTFTVTYTPTLNRAEFCMDNLTKRSLQVKSTVKYSQTVDEHQPAISSLNHKCFSENVSIASF